MQPLGRFTTLASSPCSGSGARRARALWLAAATCYVVMLLAFFMFNAPVNAAIDSWTAATLPADWASYRAKWETGHAIAAVFAAGALIFVFSAHRTDAAIVRAP